ncbi:MAG: hypothetical protein OEL19_02515 [Sulfurimonas sp.]|nr:hypothetical protein [Sulfurimonas sp.]
MLRQNVKDLIDAKAVELNSEGDLAAYVSSKILMLNDYIDQKRELSEQQVDEILSELAGYFTTTLDMPIDVGSKFLRARTYKVVHCEEEVSELSHISEENKEIVGLGRLNKEKQPIYYGCIYFTDTDGLNVAFAESNSEVGDTVNILRSKTIKEIKVRFIGIYNYVHRQSKPWFLLPNMFDSFTESYEYQEKMYNKSVFMACLLADAFFADILRRKNSGNLYKVTSKLFKIFSDSESIDGVIYTSVKSEGDPVIALKPSTVDSKIEHASCDCYRITNDFGYAKYRALHTHTGLINAENKIIWAEKTI